MLHQLNGASTGVFLITILSLFILAFEKRLNNTDANATTLNTAAVMLTVQGRILLEFSQSEMVWAQKLIKLLSQLCNVLLFLNLQDQPEVFAKLQSKLKLTFLP